MFKSDELLKIAHDMSHNTLDDLLAAIGYGKVSAHLVANRLAPEKPHPEPVSPKSRAQKPGKSAGGGMKISGMDNMLIHLSKCCNPVPGDKVVGFITRGRGVSIHTADCPNVSELAFDKERLVDVSWGDFQPGAHAVKISVKTQDKPGLLASVSSSISAAEANITHAEALTGEDRAGYPELHHRHQGRGAPELDHQEHRGRSTGCWKSAGSSQGRGCCRFSSSFQGQSAIPLFAPYRLL